MSDSKGDLLVAETRVGSVQYSAPARRRIEEFEVAVRVPGERRDAVARCNPEATKGLRSLTRPLIAAVPVIPTNRLIASRRDELTIAVRARGILQYSPDPPPRVLNHSPSQLSSFLPPLRLHVQELPPTYL